MMTLGKYRHLSRCTTAEGHFVIMAIDHRTNLLEKLNHYASAPLSDAEFAAFKQGVISALAPYASAVLTDPTYGIASAITSGAINGRIGLLAPIEVTDYDLHPSQRSLDFIPHWSVKKIKLIGGDGVKLLLPYHPEAKNVQEKYNHVAQIVADCVTYDIPFFLEPIPYSLDPKSHLNNAELLDVSIEMCQRFSAMGVDILKLSFPMDVQKSSDENEWQAACAAMSAACTVPWALLSAGVNYETFAKQSRIACGLGASGVIVGRAVWAEAVELQGAERQRFLSSTAIERMVELSTICQEAAQSCFTKLAMPNQALDWYESYSSLNATN